MARTYFQSPRSGGYGAAPSGGGLRVLTFVLGVLVIGFVALVVFLVFLGTVPGPVAGVASVMAVVVVARRRIAVRSLCRIEARK